MPGLDSLHVAPLRESQQLQALRGEVRAFIAEELRNGSFRPAIDSWMTSWDSDFSRRLAKRGWVGMTIPTEYGGHGGSFLDRFVVTEELLAAGAPVTAHWFSDRQVAPSLLRFGTEMHKRDFLPRIANADIAFAIGMSEPDAGSDLASVQTKAVRAADGWRVTGTKIWTSHAHRADYAICLVRTSPLDVTHRHSGLSQLIIDLHAEGVTVRPILSLNGEHHFNEVHFDSVHVPDSMVLGQVGEGWHQVTSELGYERSGPERFLSVLLLLEDLLAAFRAGELSPDGQFGHLFARITALHHMSLGVAGALANHGSPDAAAGVVKHLGTLTEADITEYAANLLEPQAGDEDVRRVSVERALLSRPSFTLRGGTNEILRGVIARELGLR